MTTHFITAEIAIQENSAELRAEIEKQLSKEGEPLRWAITEVNTENDTATVEAVVTTD